MKVQRRYVYIAAIFLIWMVIRIFPLVSIPGLYSLDAWIHLGYVQGILMQNFIPAVNPILYPYYNTPFLHIFAVLIHELTGLNLIASLQIVSVLIAGGTFLAFFLLFRTIFSQEWQVLVALLILALSADVIAQMNAPLPEGFGVFFLVLSLVILLQIDKKSESWTAFLICLSLFTITMAFSHHLTTLFFLLLCLAYFIAKILTTENITASIGLRVSGFSFCLALILISSNPFVYRELLLNISWVLIGTVILGIAFGLLILNKERIPSLLQWINFGLKSGKVVAIGVLSGILFIVVTVVFYPYARPILWRIIRFGLPAALLTLALFTLPKLANKVSKNFITGFIVIWLLLFLITFIGSTGISYIQGTQAFFTVFSHRHFPYLIVTFTIIATTGLSYWLFSNKPAFKQKTGSKRTIISLFILSVLGILLISGAINLYAPVGGWHQPWCSENEIRGGNWLVQQRVATSVTVTDGRLGILIQGLSPNVPSPHLVEPITTNLIQNPTFLTTSNHGYYFVSDRLETEYMVSERIGLVIFVFFTIPPSSLPSRVYLDNNVNVQRIYSNYEVTIYAF